MGTAKKIDHELAEKRNRADCPNLGGRPRKDDRLMVDAIYYILRTGSPWRDLPAVFGPWKSVYTRFTRWNESGLWERIFQELASNAEGNIRCIDCSHVKTHVHGCNPRGGQAKECLGRTKGGLNTKIAVVVDGMGRAVEVVLDKGNSHDLKSCEQFSEAIKGKIVVADRAFDSQQLRSQIVKSGGTACIPPKQNRKIKHYYSTKLYKSRHVVENLFCRIKQFRRVGTRYDKLASSFLSFVHIALCLDWITFGV